MATLKSLPLKLRSMSNLRLRSKLVRGGLDVLPCKTSDSYVEKLCYGHLKFLTSEAKVEVKFEADVKMKVKPNWGRSKSTSI